MKDTSKRVVGAIIVLVMFFSIAGSALFYTQNQEAPQETPGTELRQITERPITDQERQFILLSGGVVIEYKYKQLNYTRKTEIEDFVLQKTEGKAILFEHKSEEDKLSFMGLDRTKQGAADIKDLTNKNSSVMFDAFCSLVLVQPIPLACTLKGLSVGGQQSSPNTTQTAKNTPTPALNQTSVNSTKNETK